MNRRYFIRSGILVAGALPSIVQAVAPMKDPMFVSSRRQPSAAGGGAAGISRISAHTAQANSVAITTPTVGDVILVFAHRDGSTVAPTLPAGYLSLASSSGNTNVARIGFKVSDGTETTSGTWTNATSVAAAIYRGVDPNVPVGGITLGGASSVTMAYNAVTMQIANGSSWVAGFGAHRTATDVANAPTGMTVRSSATDIAIFDTGAGVSSWSTQTTTVNANLGWRTYTVELRAAAGTAPSPDPLVQHVKSQSSQETSNTFKIYLPSVSLSGNLLVLAFTHTTGVSVTSVTDDKSNTWTAGPTAIAGNGNHDSRLYYVAGATAATSLITVVLSASVTEFQFDLTEFHGPATSSVVDGTATGNNAAASPLVSSGSITTTQAGDLIYQYAADVVTGSFSNNTFAEGMAPDAGFSLLSVQKAMAFGSQYGVQAASGAINPQLSVLQTVNPDVFNSLSIAFKMDGSGTARSGMRIVRLVTEQSRDTATYVHQFPSSGNLIVGVTSNSSIQINWTATSDSKANSYTEVQLDTTSPQHWYAGNATTANHLRISMTAGATGLIQRWYDIEGAATSPFDVSSWATGTQGVAGESLTHAPDITPTASAGIVLTSVAFGTGPGLAVTGPTGAIFDNSPYTGETDGGVLNWGDMWAHYTYSSTAAQNWQFTTITPVASGWIAQAVAFKAP